MDDGKEQNVIAVVVVVASDSVTGRWQQEFGCCKSGRHPTQYPYQYEVSGFGFSLSPPLWYLV